MIAKFEKLLELCEYTIASIFVLVMVISITLEVVFRYFLNMPLSWCEELARFSTIWMSFIGTAIAYRHRDLVIMNIIDKIASRGVQILCNMLASLLSLLFFAVLLYGEIELQKVASASRSLALGIPMNLWSLVIVFSGLSMIFSAFRHTASDLQALKHA